MSEQIVEYKVPQLGVMLGLSTKGITPRLVRITAGAFNSSPTSSAFSNITGTSDDAQVCFLSTKHKRETIKSVAMISPDKSTIWRCDIMNDQMVQLRRIRGSDVANNINVYIVGTNGQ